MWCDFSRPEKVSLLNLTLSIGDGKNTIWARISIIYWGREGRRDDHGRWVKGFLRRIGKVSSLEVELWAIRDGLNLYNQLQLQELFIELDAKAVISLLTSNTESFAQYAHLIDDCRNLLRRHPLWKIQHCYREYNACANALVKKAVFSQLDFCLLDTPPVELSQLLMQDLSGAKMGK